MGTGWYHRNPRGEKMQQLNSSFLSSQKQRPPSHSRKAFPGLICSDGPSAPELHCLASQFQAHNIRQVSKFIMSSSHHLQNGDNGLCSQGYCKAYARHQEQHLERVCIISYHFIDLYYFICNILIYIIYFIIYILQYVYIFITYKVK